MEAPNVGCCGPLTESAISETDAKDVAPLFKAMGDPVRLRLLSMIASSNGGEVCVCELLEAFDIKAPTISHHLKVLKDQGLIDGERRGTWVYYRLNPESLRLLRTVLGC